MPQPLSSKEASLFRQVIRNYEGKQFKKGIKAADQILRKSPNHGDTLAMKALIINAQGKTDEGFKLAKAALQNDMKSHVCWHVYGLLYRTAKNYEEAIKAYKFALKLEPESQQIQRDLAMLQVQMRDYQGYIASRKSMLQQRSALRQNWTALAVANHLAGNLSTAESVLNTYEETLKTPPSKNDLEHAEALLYKNTVIAELGETERALDHLEAVSKYHIDKAAVMELRAKYLLKIGRTAEAEKAFRALIERNPDNRIYFEGLEEVTGDSKQGRKQFHSLYDEFAEKFPRADAPSRIPLDFLEGDEFKKAAETYLLRMLTKGVPSTFANVRALYTDTFKRNTVHDTVLALTSPEVKSNGAVNGSIDPSIIRSSAFYFLSQHYNYHLSRDLEQAMNYIKEALKIVPDSVDFHMTKARIWKHMGNAHKASETMEKARTLDERDRYINTKAAKYQLRDNNNDAAIKTMSKFTRNEATGGPLGDLHDMQCVWYITEDGEAYFRQGDLGLALKRFTTIYDIFDTWQEDQFDFHGFSLRKGQIRAYVEMVRWEDRLREHPFYTRGALAAIKTYLLLDQKPHLADSALVNGSKGIGADGADAAERKKEQKKAKREQQKQDRAEAAKREEKKTSTGGTNAAGEPKKEDTDPLGKELAKTAEPLKEAMKFLTPLLEFSPKNIDAQIAGFEVYFRRGKLLLALKCLTGVWNIDSENTKLHEQFLRFKHRVDNIPRDQALSEKTSQVISSTLKQTFFSNSPDSLVSNNDDFLAKWAKSPAHVLSGLQARNQLSPKTQSENEDQVARILENFSSTSHEVVQDALRLLRQWGAKEKARQLRKSAHAKWPEALAFGSEQDDFDAWWRVEVDV